MTLRPSASLVATPERLTSDPVPAVVGKATTGTTAPVSARFHQSPISSKSQIGRVWPTIKAAIFPTSRAEPPPTATTPSWLPSRRPATAASTLASTGLGRTPVNRPWSSPAAARAASTSPNRGRSANPGSVTTRGRKIPASAHAAPNSATRPGPIRIRLGNPQVAVRSWVIVAR